MPYRSTHARIPEPLKTQVSQLVDRYLEFVAENGNAEQPPLLLGSIPAEKVIGSIEDLDRLQAELDWLKRDRAALDQEINELHAKNGVLHLDLQETKAQLSDAIALVSDLRRSKPVNKLETERSPQEPTSKPVNKITTPDWQVGDKCTVVMMPSGTVCDGAVIASIESNRPYCKVYFPETESHFSVALSDLLAPAEAKEPVNKLSEASSAETANSVHKPVNDLKAMSVTQLGSRLGYHDHSYVSKVKSRPSFSGWSQHKDPDGIAWRYDDDSKLFYPVE